MPNMDLPYTNGSSHSSRGSVSSDHTVMMLEEASYIIIFGELAEKVIARDIVHDTNATLIR